MTAEQSKQQVEEMIEEIDATYYGPEERALIDKALAAARELGDDYLEYRVRMRLINSANNAGDTDALLSSFGWCLGKHDADPVRFPSRIDDGLDVMWYFKWIANVLDQLPIFSLAQCEATLDDMEAHYLRENLGLSGVITARFEHAWGTGDLATAAQLRARLAATPRDDHSHCDACVRSQLAGFAIDLGDEPLALKLVDEIIEGGFSCVEEPAYALARTLVAKLRAGRLDDARDSHLRSYRESRGNPDHIHIVSDNIAFCAITGNEARGLAMIERHISWLPHDPLNLDGRASMLAAIGLVLDSVVRTGYGDQVVRGANAPSLEPIFGSHDGVWTAAELAPVAWRAAYDITAKFDQRNGNTFCTDKINRTRALLNEHYDVPVVTEVFVPPAATKAPPATPEDWLALAEIYALYQPDPAIDAARRVLDGGTATQRARALQGMIGGYLASDRPGEARALLPERVRALREEGRNLQADLEERVGLGMWGPTQEDARPALEAELARLSATPGEELADVELTLAQRLMNPPPDDAEEGHSGPSDADRTRAAALLESAARHAVTRPALLANVLWAQTLLSANNGDADRALEVSRQILDLPLSDGRLAACHNLRAQLFGSQQRYGEGAAEADQATQIYAHYDATVPAAHNASLAAALLRDAGRREDELSRLRYGLSLAEQVELPTISFRFRIGQTLVATGHPQEGVELLWQVLQEEEAAGAPPADRADSCLNLAWGFEAAEEYGRAVGMFARAAELMKEAENWVGAADMLRFQGNLFRAFEMYDESLETLFEAWRLAESHPEAVGTQVQVLEALCFTKAGMEDPSAVAEIDRALEIVRNDPSDPYTWKVADLTDSKARVLNALSRYDEAVAMFLQAADGYAEAGDFGGAASSEHLAAQVLAEQLNRRAEAQPIWRQALAHVETALSQGRDLQTLKDSITVKLSEF